MARNAMIEPGEAGPTSPRPKMVKTRMETMLPAIGAMMTLGFMST